MDVPDNASYPVATDDTAPSMATSLRPARTPQHPEQVDNVANRHINLWDVDSEDCVSDVGTNRDADMTDMIDDQLSDMDFHCLTDPGPEDDLHDAEMTVNTAENHNLKQTADVSNDTIDVVGGMQPLTQIIHKDIAQDSPGSSVPNSMPMKPIVRPAFPNAVRDRSPVLGVKETISLRICFRVGEALNVGCQAARAGVDVLLELYARVQTSHRQGCAQHFNFVDIWNEKGPTVTGTYYGWNESELWKAESSVFLEMEGEKKLCRCIATMHRNDHRWALSVLNIWEADWDDVENAQTLFS